MSKPIVAVVGRPNVGKSTLLTTLQGSRYLLLRTLQVSQEIEYMQMLHGWISHFTLIDTGGIEPDTSDIILAQIESRQK